MKPFLKLFAATLSLINLFQVFAMDRFADEDPEGQRLQSHTYDNEPFQLEYFNAQFHDNQLGYRKPEPADDDNVARGAWNNVAIKDIAFVDKYAPFVKDVHFSDVSDTLSEAAYVLEFKPQLIAAMAEFDVDSPETLKEAVIAHTVGTLPPELVSNALIALGAPNVNLSTSKALTTDDVTNRHVLRQLLLINGNLKLTK